VQSVDADSQLAVRLRELGIVPGAQMMVKQSGQPMIVQVGETRLCLRGEEAGRVVVDVPLPVDFASPEYVADAAQ
jgi:Fe2+ transport system protein FeoA